MIANAASFVLPISNPANLVVFHGDMPGLGQWLLRFGVPAVISIVATVVVLRWVFRKELGGRIEEGVAVSGLDAHGGLVLAGLGVVAVVLLTVSALRIDLGLPTCLAAMAITAVVSAKARSNPVRLAKGISWATIALVAGLFILVNAVESLGALRVMESWLSSVQELGTATGALVTSFVVAVANNLVNNLPLGLIAGGTLQAAHVKGLLSDAVLIGVDLGPNLSITGSLATILWLLALRREGLNVEFLGFLKVGAVAMPVALLLTMCSAILMRMALGVF
jgi:arsenical pump membrane protein